MAHRPSNTGGPPVPGARQPEGPEVTEGLAPQDFAIMMAACHVCVLLHDAETKDIMWANPAARRMLEFTLEEIRPLKAPDMSSQAREYNRAIGRAWLQRANERGSSWIEWHYRSKSGRTIPTEAVATRIELSRGPAVMVQFRDIEHEQSIEKSLHRTEEYFHALARFTSAGAVALTEDGVIEYVSDNALQQFRVAREQMVGRHISDFCAVNDARGRTVWRTAIQLAYPVNSVQLQLDNAKFGRIWLGGSLDRVCGQGGDVLLLTLHDITDRVANGIAQGREMEYENYLSRYNAMGDMAMAIAHELGQPLAAASNFLAGARVRGAGTTEEEKRPRTDTASYALDGARKQVDRASKIVTALREFVGHLEQVEMLVDLNDVVADCMYFIRLRARNSGVRVHESFNDMPIPVRCERVLTGQVVMNLCFNAVDEMARWPEHERDIYVSVAAEPDRGRFAVEDRGQGLGHLEGTNVFDQLFTEKEQGSGIGLALSNRIIARQHGQLFGWSCEPRGAIFSFTLPLAEDRGESGS